MCFSNKQDPPPPPQTVSQSRCRRSEGGVGGRGVDYSDDCLCVWQLGGLQGACDVKTFHRYQGSHQDNVLRPLGDNDTN